MTYVDDQYHDKYLALRSAIWLVQFSLLVSCYHVQRRLYLIPYQNIFCSVRLCNVTKFSEGSLAVADPVWVQSTIATKQLVPTCSVPPLLNYDTQKLQNKSIKNQPQILDWPEEECNLDCTHVDHQLDDPLPFKILYNWKASTPILCRSLNRRVPVLPQKPNTILVYEMRDLTGCSLHGYSLASLQF